LVDVVFLPDLEATPSNALAVFSVKRVKILFTAA